MTAAQAHATRPLIPCAFELNAPPYRAARSPSALAAAPAEAPRAQPVTEAYVVAAPHSPTTRFGFAAAIVGDLALCLAIIYAVAVVPALVIKGVAAAAGLFTNGS